MLFTHRLRLLAFGLFAWVISMMAAADPATPALVQFIAPVQGGIGGLLFATALLPGRMARFS